MAKDRVISATEFKAKCLALLDDVDEKGGSITVTKRGRPVATLRPAPKARLKFPWGAWKGKIEIEDDMTPLEWDVVREIEGR